MPNIPNLIEKFVQIASETWPEDVSRVQALILVLDQLTTEVQTVEYDYDETDYDDPPGLAYDSLRNQIAPLFPEFGFYNTVIHVSEQVGQTEFGVGDAIDDLADILSDLKEVEWRYRNTSVADALFHFQLTYRNHWGRHARDLQLYMHDQQR